MAEKENKARKGKKEMGTEAGKPWKVVREARWLTPLDFGVLITTCYSLWAGYLPL